MSVTRTNPAHPMLSFPMYITRMPTDAEDFSKMQHEIQTYHVQRRKEEQAKNERIIEKLFELCFSISPSSAYKTFEEELELGNKSKQIREFRVAFRTEPDGKKTLRSFGIRFSGEDLRTKTAIINGKRGGRPRDPNPSKRALAARARREKVTNPETQSENGLCLCNKEVQ